MLPIRSRLPFQLDYGTESGGESGALTHILVVCNHARFPPSHHELLFSSLPPDAVATVKALLLTSGGKVFWRREWESNPPGRFCRPSPKRSDIAPKSGAPTENRTLVSTLPRCCSAIEL